MGIATFVVAAGMFLSIVLLCPKSLGAGSGLQRQSKSVGSREMVFVATAYCSCKKCCSHTHGITKSGRRAEARWTAACPKKMMGKVLWIDELGHALVCEDTGSKIKGRRIDIFMRTHKEALEFGVKRMRVRVF